MSDPFSGGNSTYDSGGYRYRVFTADGTLVKADATAVDVDYLIVAGGGGGGGYFSGGGGGAGGVLADTDELTTAGNYAIVVGDGGTGGVATQNSDQSIGTDGEASSFNGHSATGGGGGGGRISTNVDQPGRAGGSGGGGGGRSSAAGGNGTAGQGNNGGAARSGTTAGTGAGGGGGGKGAVGSAGNSSNVGGNGGAGYQWLDGNYYAGGGGGGAISGSTGGTGGTGGGGDGGAGSGNPGENGTANTGGGGGGGGNTSTTGSAGGDGGSGIVVVRYAIDPILISAAPVDHASIVVTFDTPLPGADSHNLYRSATQGFTPGAGNRILTGLSATPTPVTDTGLDSETTYYYVAGGVIGGVETLSAEVSATTALSPGQYSTFFGEYTADAAPDDWSALFGTTSEFVIKDGETHFDRALRMTIASGNRVARVWDDVGVASGTVQACAVVNRQINDSASNGVILAAGGEAGVEYGYALFLSSATLTLTTAIIRRYEAGAATQLGSWTFANYDSSGGAGYPYGLLFEYNPATGALRAKAWRVLDFEDPLANIPATWQEFSDAAPLPLGKVGLWGFNADTYRCGYFSAGTGGLAAQLPAEVGVALRWSVPGAVTDTSAAIVVATTTDASVVVEYDTDAAFGSVASSAATASEAPAFAARVALTGLDPDTQYYYRIKLDGGAAHAETGAFKTAPTPGTAKTFSVSTASCSDTDSDHAIFGVLEDEVHDLFLHTGDLHYLNISTDSDELFQSGYHRSIGIPAQNAAYRIKAWDYVWDDHDWGANNSDASSASAPAAQTVYRQLAPHYSIPAGPEAPIYHAFTWGRVRFIVTDLRSERSANSATDNASKTMLGATQKAWFKSELTDARDAGLAIAWVCTSVWPGATANGTDGWRSFNTERTELADFFQDEDLLSRMVIISGDWHALGLDDGTNSNFATTPVGNGPPVLQCAPLDQVPTSVPFTPSEGYRAPESGEGQYALITFTDAGGTSITVTYSGYYVSAGGVKTLWQTADYVVDAVVPPTEPGAPVITAAQTGPEQLTVTVTTPGANAADHQLYLQEDTATGLFDAGNLVVDELGTTPAPIVIDGVALGAVLYFGLRASNAYGTADSAAATLTMTEVRLEAVGITYNSATLQLLGAGYAIAVRYLTTTLADTEYAAAIDDETLTDASRFYRPLMDLPAATPLRSKEQHQSTEGGPWSDWLEIEWETAAAPADTSRIVHPVRGEPISGLYCIEVELAAGRTVTDIEISDDEGVTWVPLAALCFDSTVHADGWYQLRVTTDLGTQLLSDFRIDNEERIGTLTCEDAIGQGIKAGHVHVWETSNMLSSLGLGCTIKVHPWDAGGWDCSYQLSAPLGYLLFPYGPGGLALRDATSQRISAFMTLDPNCRGPAYFYPHYGQENMKAGVATHVSDKPGGGYYGIRASVEVGQFTPTEATPPESQDLVIDIEAPGKSTSIVVPFPAPVLVPWWPTSYPWAFEFGTGAEVELDVQQLEPGGKTYSIRAWGAGVLMYDQEWTFDAPLPPGIPGITQRSYGGGLHFADIQIFNVCTPDVVHVTEIRRLEVWSDVEGAEPAGEVLAYVPKLISAEDERELMGEERIRLLIKHGSPGTEEIIGKRVLRTIYLDFTWEEWRIEVVEDTRLEDGSLALKVEAVGIIFDLSHGRVQQVQENGNIEVDFDPPAMSLSDHVGGLILTSPGIKSHFTEGAMADALPVEVSYQGDTPLSAVQALAAAGEVEYHVVRACGKYEITMPEQIGSSAPIVRMRYRKNIRELTRELDFSRLATRAYPRGGEQDGFALTIAAALWEITDVDDYDNLVTLAGEPIAFDQQLDGLKARKYGTTADVVVISTNVETQQVELSSVAHLDVGDFLNFRDPDGRELLYMDRPSSIETWGTWSPPDAVDAADVPPVDNLMVNPYLDAWPSGSLTGWTAEGAATIQQVTDRLFHRYGIAAARVICTADGTGIESGWHIVAPVGPVLDSAGNVIGEGSPYFTVQLALWIAAGAIRLELDVDTVGDGSAIITLPDAGAKATSNELGVWIESLAMNCDLHALGAKRVRVRVVQEGATAATFILDAVQLTQTHGGAVTFYDRRASNELWQRGILHLAQYSEPIATYDCLPVDLYRLNPEDFVADELILGGGALVEDVNIGDVEARLIWIGGRSLKGRRGVTRIRVSAIVPALVKLIQAERERRRRRLGSGGGTPPAPPTPPPPVDPPPGHIPGGTLSNLSVTLVQATGGAYYHQVAWSHNQAVEDDATSRFTVTVLSDEGAGGDLGPAATGRDPTLEHDDADSVALVGSFRFPRSPAAKVLTNYHVFMYRVELYDSQATNPAAPVQRLETSIDGYYQLN
jgi:hypothetical protein